MDVVVIHNQTATASFALDLMLDPPFGLQAHVVDFTDVHVSWNAPGGGGGELYELSYHLNTPLNAYYESWDYGYGVVYDVSGFSNVTIEKADYHHASWGLSGTWDYKLHVVNWDTYTLLYSTPVLQTTGDDKWEVNIPLGSIPESGLVGIFLEPMGNEATDAYPNLSSDNATTTTNSFFGPLSSFSGMGGSAIGNFLMDLWIMAGPLDGGERVLVQAPVIEGAAIASHSSRVAPGTVNAQIASKEYVGAGRALTGFNVYRNEDFLVSTAADVTEIDDLDLDAGTYAYTVKAVYDQGESEAVGPKTVAILPPPILLSADADYYGVDLVWEDGANYPVNLATGDSYSLSNVMDNQALTEKEKEMHGPNSIVPKATSGRAIGDDCNDPIILDLTTLPVVDFNTTCGRGNTYSETCLGNYDSGEDIVYQFTLTEAKDLKLTLTTVTTWTGMLITQECPISLNCVTFVTGYDGNKVLNASLAAGTYYVMIDTWAAPDCIPEFTLTIEEFVPEPGEMCGTAVTATEGLNSAPLQPYWYEFTPTEDKAITISSCIEGQIIDTKLEVYDACGGNLVAANDDLYAECSYYNYASGVTFNATAGVSYKIFWLNPYSSAAFDFTIELSDPCVVLCPPEGIDEGEPCGEDLNGGCNAETPAYTPIASGDVICGTAYANGETRDTDWYELVLDAPKTITWQATAEFPVSIFIVDAKSGDCSDYEILSSITAAPCETALLTATVAPGTYWLLVMPSTFDGVQCDAYNNYVAELTTEDAFLTYYNVFRDGVDIADVYTGNTYRDGDVVNGEEYCYTVSKVESVAFETAQSNELCATVPLIPEIVVNPESFNKLLYIGTSETETLTVENTGAGTLDFDINIIFNSKDNTAPNVEWNFHKTAVGASAQSNTISHGKEHNARVDELLWDNLVVGSTSGIVSVDLTGIVPDGRTITADDFVVPDDETWTINYVYTEGFSNETVLPDAFGVEFYTDNNGKPGTLISAEDVIPANINFATQDLILTNPVVLPAGHYWVSVYGVYEGSTGLTNTRWNWYTGNASIGNEASLNDFAGLFGLDPGWFYLSEIGVADAASCSFQLEGTKGAASSWISMDVTSGSIDGIGQIALDVTFDASNLDIGIYNATISISSNDPLAPVVSVPVELEVYADYGILSGHVTDALTRGPVGYVTITVDELRYTATTDENGYYELDVLPGNYTVTAEKAGYITQTAEVTIIAYEPTTQDFLLEFAGPVLLYADGGVGEINLGWTGNPAVDGDNAIRYSTSNVEMNKERLHGPTVTLPIESGRAIGDDCNNPIMIGALPYTDVNTTCGRGNTYDATCLGTYDGGEDIIYQLVITEDMTIEIDMTTTATWTGMLITMQCPIDSTCVATITGSGGPKNMVVDLVAGTYYIMLDTWPSPNCFDFTLTVSEYVPCILEMPAGAIAEGEPCIEDQGVDVTNGGCNMAVPAFTPINCGDVIWGSASTYLVGTGQNRDTDWYEFVITEPKAVTFTVTAEFPVVAGILEQVVPGVAGCDNTTGSISPYALANPCDAASVTATLIPGTYYFWVSPSVFEGYPCGVSNNYIAELTCEETFVPYFNVIRDGDIIAQTYLDTYADSDVMSDVEYCYTVSQVIEPGVVTPESNELCASVFCATGCDYTMILTDQYGDGWNGASLTVMQGTNEIGTYTLASGLTTTIAISLCDATETTLIWNKGSWDAECGFEMLDPNGEVLVSFLAGGAPAVSGEFFTFTTECP
ncbi:MAG: carboxypeptidase-like regulatory domain-containing protein, partial [Pseudomonas sp.]|nr:carboxypeptidase-like regulatory domain-containing protein [Pseudomonas sp.]